MRKLDAVLVLLIGGSLLLCQQLAGELVSLRIGHNVNAEMIADLHARVVRFEVPHE